MKAAEKRAIVRSPVRKLVMHKGGSKHAFAFAARH